jgi:hypothetical protein
MPVYGEELLHIQPPVDRQLEGASAWITNLTGRDVEVPDGWGGPACKIAMGSMKLLQIK